MEYNKNKIHSFSYKNAKLKNRKDLRIKLTKLSNKYFKPRCEHFINNIRSLNFRILESSGGKKSIDKEVKESRNFRFGKTKDYFIHLTDLSPYQVKLSPFINTLKHQFTKEEINIIKKDKDYYIQNQFIKENVPIFNDQSLYQILNNEEKDEEIAKNNVKVFRNLNYFNKRRKSIVAGINAISLNNSINRIDSKNLNNIKTLYRKKAKNVEENSNLSNFFLKRNILDIIEKDIRKGVDERRKEEKKINLINEKTKNIVYDISRESQSEIEKILNEEGFKNYSNYNYYITNQISFFSNNYKAKKNKTENSFPIINNKNNINPFRTVSPIKKNNKKESIPFYDSNIIKNKNEKEKRNKIQINLYKKEKMKEIIQKKEENEQMILRDINRKIKSIYDDYKNHKLNQ